MLYTKKPLKDKGFSDLFGSRRKCWKWTRSQSIRTTAQIPIAIALTKTVPPPTYQVIADEALQLSKLGLSQTKIAFALNVTDKTVAKALRWIRQSP